MNVTVVKEKWPTNRWPRDKKYKQIGMLSPSFPVQSRGGNIGRVAVSAANVRNKASGTRRT